MKIKLKKDSRKYCDKCRYKLAQGNCIKCYRLNVVFHKDAEVICFSIGKFKYKYTVPLIIYESVC